MTDLANDLRVLVEGLERRVAMLRDDARALDAAEPMRVSMIAHANEAEKTATRLRALLAKHEGACRCEFKTCDQQTVHRRDCPRYDGPVHTQ